MSKNYKRYAKDVNNETDKDQDFKGKQGKNARGKGGSTFSKDPNRGNHIEWYARNSELLNGSASFAYGWPAGNKIDINTDAATNVHVDTFSTPGVQSFRFLPTIGISRDRTSPVNIAATNVYSFIRHANSGSKNYDAPDLMMYLLAVDSAYMLHSFMRRIYGLVNVYSQTNRYYPRAIIESMGVNFDSIVDNIANFRYLINRYAVQVGALCIPSDMSYHRRHMWLCENIYVDDPMSAKAQTYLFTPGGFYKYSNTGPTGSELTITEDLTIRPNLSSADKWHFEDFVSACKAILAPIVSDEDIGIMSGDILKAYGPDRVTKLFDTPDYYTVLPQYDIDVLKQIQNMTIVGPEVPVNTKDAELKPHRMVISQNPEVNEGTILSDPWFDWTMANFGTTKPLNLNGLKKIVSMPTDVVTPEDNMRASRLCNMSTGFGKVMAKNAYCKFDNIGTEVITNADIYAFAENESNRMWELNHVAYGSWVDSTIYAGPLTQMYIDSFKYHPLVYLIDTSNAETGPKYLGFSFELNNFTTWTEHDVAKMHETALISMFDVPQAGRAK